MKISTLMMAPFAAVLLLASCASTEKNPLPLYLAPESAMDEPGTSTAREAEFNKRQKDGIFKVGETVYVSQGKSYFFAQNPEIDGDNGGKMMNADSVTIASCEGMYYYVKTLDGDGGYLRESDLISAAARDPLNLDGDLMDGVIFGDPTAAPVFTGGGALFPTTDGLTISMPKGEDPNARKVLTNAQGRVVTLETKKTEASDRYKEKTASIPFTKSDSGSSTGSNSTGEALPELPESNYNPSN